MYDIIIFIRFCLTLSEENIGNEEVRIEILLSLGFWIVKLAQGFVHYASSFSSMGLKEK